MNFSSRSYLILLAFSLINCSFAQELDAVTQASPAEVQRAEAQLRRTQFGNAGALDPLIGRIRRKHRRCVPSVCFLLTGSQALSAEAEKVQRDFVFTAAGLLSIANPRISLSAVQYSQLSNPISRPTRKPQVFQERILRKSFRKTQRVRIAPALLHCLSHFAKQNRAPRKIVVLADSAAPRVRERGPLRPAAVSRFFRRASGSDICAVTVGRRGRKRLRKIVGGDNNILEADAWGVLQLRSLLEPLVDSVCKDTGSLSSEWNLFDE